MNQTTCQTLFELLNQVEDLLLLTLDHELNILYSNKGWSGNLSQWVEEHCLLELNTLKEGSNAFSLVSQKNKQTYLGQLKKQKNDILFVGNRTAHQTVYQIELDRAGVVTKSNHPNYLQSYPYTHHLKDHYLIEKLTCNFKACIQNKFATGFEFSVNEHLGATDFHQFEPQANGALLTIEKLDFEDNGTLKNAYFQSIVENSTDFVYKCDVKGNFVYVNSAMNERYGFEIYKKKKRKKIHFLDWVRKDYKKIVKKFYSNQLKNGIKNTYLEFPTVTESGEEIWIGQNVQVVYSGQWIMGIQATSRDITDNKIIESELMEIQGKNQAILDSIPDSMYVVNDRFELLDKKVESDSSFFDIEIGSTLAQAGLEEKCLSKFVFSLGIAFEYFTIQKLIFSSQSMGNLAFFDVRITPIDEKQALILVRNITESKLHDQKLQLAQEQEKNALNAKQRYLSFMSHEIRTPLNAIMGLNDLLLDTEPTAKQTEYLKSVRASGSILSKIINDVLDFNKLESNNIKLESQGFNLGNLVKEVVNSCNVYSYQKPVELKSSIAPDTPIHLKGDSLKLTQILTNLLGNALKFTQQGEVSLTIEPKNIHPDQVTIHFLVQDTGIGIPKDKQKLIFNSYEQVDASISRKFGGTGLGLTITKRFVELMGGTIQIESEPNIGSAFSFALTFELSKDPIIPESSPIRVNLSPYHILLVEDNEMNQLVMSKYFKKWGISYHMANNGTEALEIIEDQEFNLIFLDLEMPIKDGFETASAIRANPNKDISQTPIIALSASIYSEIAERINQIGFNDFIGKPFDSNNVYSVMVQYLVGKDKDKMKYQSKNSSHHPISYDLTYLMESSLNDTSYVNKMIDIFRTKSPVYLKEMSELHQDNDLKELRKLAHKFKASVAIMGVKKAELAIIELEHNIIHQSRLDEIDDLLKLIDAEVTKACQEIEMEIIQTSTSRK